MGKIVRSSTPQTSGALGFGLLSTALAAAETERKDVTFPDKMSPGGELRGNGAEGFTSRGHPAHSPQDGRTRVLGWNK